MVRHTAWIVATLLGGCGGGGGGGTGKGPTTPDNKSPGSVVYEEQPGGFAPATPPPPSAKPKGPAPQDIEPVERAAPKPTPGGPNAKAADTPDDAIPKPAVRAPTQDLPPDKRDQLVREQLGKGAQSMQAHDADGTIRAARAALELDETNVEGMILLAHGYYAKEYDDKVEAVLTIAKNQAAGARHPVLWMLLGLTYDRTNRETQALEAYEQATQLKPDYLAALTNKGQIYLRRKRYADAIQVFERVKQIQASARASTMLGAAFRGRSADVLDQRDDFLRKAELELKTAMTKDASYPPAYFDMGILYLDADPFPGLEKLARLENASRYLKEYKRLAGPAAVAIVDDYLTAADKGVDLEKKAIERKKKKDAEKAKGKGGNP